MLLLSGEWVDEKLFKTNHQKIYVTEKGRKSLVCGAFKLYFLQSDKRNGGIASSNDSRTSDIIKAWHMEQISVEKQK